MTLHSQAITEFWSAAFRAGVVLLKNDGFVAASNPELPDDRRVMMLEAVDGTVTAVLAPGLATALGLSSSRDSTESAFRQTLAAAGITMHGADYLFYFADADKDALLHEDPGPGVRRLTEQDRAEFAEFQAAASAEDLESAYVELDHWAA